MQRKFCLVLASCLTALGVEPINIGSRLELFVDDYLVESMNGVTRELHSPERKGPVMVFDRPWEGGASNYVTVFADSTPDGAPYFRMYYRAEPLYGQYGDTVWNRADWAAILGPDVTCYAESRDGINWTRPKLDIFAGEFTSRFQKKYTLAAPNNVVWIGKGPSTHASHNFAPFKDTNPACKPEARYKAIGRMFLEDTVGSNRIVDPNPPKPDSTGYAYPPGCGLMAFQSSDGIHWSLMQKERVVKKTETDWFNVAFWDSERGEYRMYQKLWAADGQHIRSVVTMTSDDFLHWSDIPKWLEYDYGDLPPPPLSEQIYSSSVLPYYRAPHIFVAFCNRLRSGRVWVEEHPKHDVADAFFMSSRDGLHFDREQEGWIRPGLDPKKESWIHANTLPAWGLLETAPGELSVYWVDHYLRPSLPAQLQRGTLRTDGFFSMHVKYSGGEFTTKPLKFTGRELVMNFSTSAVGSVRVEIQDRDGKPLPGFTLADCPEIYGDAIDEVVKWKAGSDVSILAGQAVRLRFVMKDADLYSIRFRP